MENNDTLWYIVSGRPHLRGINTTEVGAYFDSRRALFLENWKPSKS